ncbi:MAG TPA: dTDP-glucose 4,6-dehydratase [Pyrinomonadaceae bacterium]|nr:dTDP-glucose 4,6-dehydratase [Pyrinomonadaceae bacterium]HMP64763.1 dTDP-glucose 4,6-dehydratase [Pyrinomonadaceae bacterium]
MSVIFVTGGAGFIGSEFVRQAVNELADERVVVFDALTYAGSLDNLEGVDASRYSFVEGDICDRDAVLQAMPSGCDAVFNFAAETHVDRSIKSANEFVRTNVLGAQVLLDVARERGAGRFIQISTDEVTGNVPEGSAPFDENSPTKPNSPYAASKAAAEMMVRAAVRTHGLDAVITRSGNNYGPRQYPEKLIPLMISHALRDEPLPVYGDGLYRRDWVHVEDNCRAIRLAFEQGRTAEIYSVGARNERTNLEVVKAVLDILEKPHSLIRHTADRPGHDRRYATDPSKAEAELGWQAEVEWEAGLKKTVAWYLENRSRLDAASESG